MQCACACLRDRLVHAIVLHEHRHAAEDHHMEDTHTPPAGLRCGLEAWGCGLGHAGLQPRGVRCGLEAWGCSLGHVGLQPRGVRCGLEA